MDIYIYTVVILKLGQDSITVTTGQEEAARTSEAWSRDRDKTGVCPSCLPTTPARAAAGGTQAVGQGGSGVEVRPGSQPPEAAVRPGSTAA